MKKNQLNILIVDDDESSRNALTEVINRAGYKSTPVDKVDLALNMVRIKPIHGAIIDCMLPKKNGVQLAEEMRQSRFGNGPIIFISGIFKDRAFAQDAIGKVDAVDFLLKPLPMDHIIKIFDEKLSSLIDAPKIPLHALLSRPYASERERLKALESIEEVSGLDLPLILSILLDANFSGYLNLVNQSGEISGITFHQGAIVKVDTSESDKIIAKKLVSSGFLNTEDFAELPDNKKRGDVIKNLISDNLVSPHAVEVVRKDQMLDELEKFVREEKLQINFVPERTKTELIGIRSKDLTPFYYSILQNIVPLKWLEEFYHHWLGHPMRLGPEYSSNHEANEFIAKDLNADFISSLMKERSMEEILEMDHFDRSKFFKMIHLIALRRLIVFDEQKKSKMTVDQLEKLKLILRDISEKNPFEIFSYFGADKKSSAVEVEKIYKEFAKSNHPDTIDSKAPQELKEVVNKVFALVSNAYDILSNETKRERYLNDQKQRDAEKQLNAERLSEEGFMYLKRGQIKASLEKLNQAMKVFSSHNTDIYWSWATLKSYNEKLPPKIIKEVQKKMDSIPADARRSAEYLFVTGLLKKGQGDTEGALAQFDKSLSLDPNFLEVRREISGLRQMKEPNTDTFTGELTSIVGRLFKKQIKNK